MSAEAERKIDVIYQELTRRFPSRSRLRWLDEGPVDTLAGMLLNTDANTHLVFVKELAKLGHPETLALLNHLASGDPAKYPGRADDIQLAQAILAEAAPAQAEAYKAPAPQIVYVDRVVDAPQPSLTPPQPAVTLAALEPTSSGGTTGQIIGRAYDALEELRLADALPIENRAPLAALIAVLQTKNGSAI